MAVELSERELLYAERFCTYGELTEEKLLVAKLVMEIKRLTALSNNDKMAYLRQTMEGSPHGVGSSKL